MLSEYQDARFWEEINTLIRSAREDEVLEEKLLEAVEREREEELARLDRAILAAKKQAAKE